MDKPEEDTTRPGVLKVIDAPRTGEPLKRGQVEERAEVWKALRVQ